MHTFIVQVPNLRQTGDVGFFPHKREDGGFEQLDLLVLREDEFGCFTPLLHGFLSAFFQVIRSVRGRDSIKQFAGREKTEGKRKKEQKKFRSDPPETTALSATNLASRLR